MVSRLRLCRATQSARASASATVPIASTSTASCSPKINVDVIGSKPNASPKGFGRSPTIVFPGAVKTFTLSVFDATGAVLLVASFNAFEPSIGYSFRLLPKMQILIEPAARRYKTEGAFEQLDDVSLL